jgi:pyruvate dehydrogenase E1 component alpha subunit
MKSSHVDGMNLLKVREAAEVGLQYVKSGKGPYLLEAMTYRFRGHSMGDPERYRKQDEVHLWQENDPIGIYQKYLEESHTATERELLELNRKANEEIQKAVEFAEASPDPAPEELFEHIYMEP